MLTFHSGWQKLGTHPWPGSILQDDCESEQPRTDASLFLTLRSDGRCSTSTSSLRTNPFFALCFWCFFLLAHRRFEVTFSVFADWNESAKKPRCETINRLPGRLRLRSQPCPSSPLIYRQTHSTWSIQTLCSNLYTEKLSPHCFQRFPDLSGRGAECSSMSKQNTNPLSLGHTWVNNTKAISQWTRCRSHICFQAV